MTVWVLVATRSAGVALAVRGRRPCLETIGPGAVLCSLQLAALHHNGCTLVRRRMSNFPTEAIDRRGFSIRVAERRADITFHFTPTSTSWMNAAEGLFAKWTKRRLKSDVFHSIGGR
jgi:hypothetical protein